MYGSLPWQQKQKASNIEQELGYLNDSVSHDEAPIRQLRDNPAFAVQYLKAGLEEDSEPRVRWIALRRVVQAGGIAKIANPAGVEREGLYRALSTGGNPRLSTLAAVTNAVGLRLTVDAAR